MTDIASARALIVEARAVLGSDRVVDAEIVSVGERLESPLRIALAGTVKAGKSTLLNALVGEEIAPADATECTRVVTWFVRGRTPSISLTVDGRSRDIPVERTDGRLTLNLGGIEADHVQRLEVSWPSSLLDRYTVVDTPGTASNSRDVSRRTMDLLVPASGRCDIDAIVYLTRELQQSDVDMLTRIRDAGGTGPLGVITVHSRADEVAGGREWSPEQASDTSMVPVSGLLALRGRTLRQREFDAFAALAGDHELDRSLVSTGTFTRADLTPGIAVRHDLVRQFGLFGIRSAVAAVRGGATTAPALAAELVRRSGVTELQARIDTQFGARHEHVRVHRALTELQGLLAARLDARSAPLLTRIDRILAADHTSEELTVLSSIRFDDVVANEWQRSALECILGGRGIAPRERLGLSGLHGDTDVIGTARAAVRYWRAQLANPLLGPTAARAYRAAARSAEAIVATPQRVLVRH